MQGKTAIITGGGSGFGREAALKLAQKGVNISVVDLSKEKGEETVQLCEELGSAAIFIQADVSKVEDVKKYVNETVGRFGKIDLFFNNAGISGSGVRTLDCSEEEFDAIVNVNLKGVFYGLKYVVTEMLKTGGGAIVNTASLGGLVGMPTLGAYSATKHAVIGLTKTIAGEYGRENIRINAIAPGTNETPMVKAFPTDAIKAMADAVPMGRLGQPHEVGNVVAFLLSDEAAYIHGAVISIDGGSAAL
ncbi:SDR family NAD(P)-dependent oxidoreductase [Neobacillus niacini]|uniref:SDR family NAD(P)-dependent oxidoreductase n=1 Tax=Neobacillus niacini TaxID=86668 RepID=UPI00052FAF40|nr:SDR family NAD(P)-dependent oxidoreductase [Neobacillus niacini]KGM46282.1 short-chain dehydrogenase [Neobacillus niacini]MEC1525895.1 SDR family NAD(P)-dependent oxidoreductase [Neobacillus niacini]